MEQASQLAIGFWEAGFPKILSCAFKNNPALLLAKLTCSKMGCLKLDGGHINCELHHMAKTSEGADLKILYIAVSVQPKNAHGF